MTGQKHITEKIGILFKKYGIRSITMDEVARELGMSKKTLYQIVPDKSKLVEMVITEEFLKYQNKLNTIQAEQNNAIYLYIKLNELLYEFLLDFSPATTYDLEKYEPVFYHKIKNDYVSLFINAIRENLEHGKNEGLYRAELDVDIISKIPLARIEQISNSKIFSQEEFTSPQFVKEICFYHLHGVLNANGMELLKEYEQEIDNILKSKVI